MKEMVHEHQVGERLLLAAHAAARAAWHTLTHWGALVLHSRKPAKDRGAYAAARWVQGAGQRGCRALACGVVRSHPAGHHGRGLRGGFDGRRMTPQERDLIETVASDLRYLR